LRCDWFSHCFCRRLGLRRRLGYWVACFSLRRSSLCYGFALGSIVCLSRHFGLGTTAPSAAFAALPLAFGCLFGCRLRVHFCRCLGYAIDCSAFRLGSYALGHHGVLRSLRCSCLAACFVHARIVAGIRIVMAVIAILVGGMLAATITVAPAAPPTLAPTLATVAVLVTIGRAGLALSGHLLRCFCSDIFLVGNIFHDVFVFRLFHSHRGNEPGRRTR